MILVMLYSSYKLCHGQIMEYWLTNNYWIRNVVIVTSRVKYKLYQKESQ